MTMKKYYSVQDALIPLVVNKWNELSSKPIGRTIIQKLFYFLKQKSDNITYEFEMHHYGPYSFELSQKMDDLILNQIMCDASEDRQKSKYQAGEQGYALIEEYSEYIQAVAPVVDNVVSELCQYNPRTLELIATVHYVNTGYKRYFQKEPSSNVIVDLVMDVKGNKFSEKTIIGACDALSRMGMLHSEVH